MPLKSIASVGKYPSKNTHSYKKLSEISRQQSGFGDLAYERIITNCPPIKFQSKLPRTLLQKPPKTQLQYGFTTLSQIYHFSEFTLKCAIFFLGFLGNTALVFSFKVFVQFVRRVGIWKSLLQRIWDIENLNFGELSIPKQYGCMCSQLCAKMINKRREE